MYMYEQFEHGVEKSYCYKRNGICYCQWYSMCSFECAISAVLMGVQREMEKITVSMHMNALPPGTAVTKLVNLTSKHSINGHCNRIQVEVVILE